MLMLSLYAYADAFMLMLSLYAYAEPLIERITEVIVK